MGRKLKRNCTESIRRMFAPLATKLGIYLAYGNTVEVFSR